MLPCHWLEGNDLICNHSDSRNFFPVHFPETRSRQSSKKHHTHRGHDLQSHENNTDSSSTCSLTTIDEEQATPTIAFQPATPTYQLVGQEDKVPLLQESEEGEGEEVDGERGAEQRVDPVSAVENTVKSKEQKGVVIH